jgi:ATP-dependent Clp protease protease subunit
MKETDNMPNRKDKYWNQFLNDWDGDATDGDSKGSRTTVFSSKEDRLFYVYGDINARNCADVAYDISQINIEDDDKDRKEKDFKRKPIKIYFNSFGGSVYDMWLLVDTILGSKTPVHTYCTGYAMSAAFVIFLAGHKRYMSPHATLMYHQIYCWRSGKYQDLVDDREQTDHLNDMIEQFVVERSGLTKEDLLNIREKKKDTYFSAKEAKEKKIITDIIGFTKKQQNSD